MFACDLTKPKGLLWSFFFPVIISKWMEDPNITMSIQIFCWPICQVLSQEDEWVVVLMCYVNCTILFGWLCCSCCLWMKSLLKVLWFLMPELDFILQRNKANQASYRSNCPVLLTLKYTVYVHIHSYGLNYFLNNKIFFIPPFGAPLFLSFPRL